jgi:diguanylate cyclase (GGDEF)-like protein
VVLGAGANLIVSASRRRAHGLELVIETQAEIAAADSDLDTLMAMTAESALRLTGAEAACIELLDGDDVVCSAAAGLGRRYLGMRLVAAETLTGECFRSGEVITCGDSQSDTYANREACRAVGARSMILVPLLDGAVVRGVLIVWSSTTNDFGGHVSQLLALLSNMVGAAFARAELVAQLTGLSVTDELTGLPNRRSWYEELDRSMGRARRSGHPLSVLVIDLDDFKLVNDREGHAAGDRVLKEVSSRWIGVSRGGDLLGRIGGDEFAVILEDSDATNARRVADRFEAALGGRYRASIGIARWDYEESSDDLVARADTSMYRQKRSAGSRGIEPAAGRAA